MVVPALGIPTIWKEYFIMGLGFLFLVLGYIVRRSDYFRTLEHPDGTHADETFVETTAPLFSDTKVQ